MKYCLGCKTLISRTLAVQHDYTRHLDALYHWGYEFVGPSDQPMIVRYQERFLCGPLRELTEEEKAALDEMKRLDDLLGKKS